MITFKKFTSLMIYMTAIASLSACSSVPDRYAFWSSDISNVHDTSGTAPNLADVPVKPAMQEKQDDIEDMRQRLQNDNNNAYSDQRDAYLDYQPDTTLQNYQSSSAINNAAPVFTPNSVQINYGALNDAPAAYVYGRSPALYNQYYAPSAGYANYDSYGAYGTEIATLMSQNPSITINPLPDFDGVYANESDAIMPEGQLLFKHGSSRLSPKDRSYIKGLAETLKSDYTPLRIVGHASTRVELNDPYQARLVNLKMSEKRATAVYKEFKKYGIAADRLNITAHGDSVPNIPVQGLSEEASDRRVEILFDQ